MAEKDNSKNELAGLKAEISAGNLGRLYVLRGNEDYLREYYLGVMRKKVLGDALVDFNYKKLQGEKITLHELAEAIDALPVFAERTFIEIRDFDLFSEGEERQSSLIELLSDVPEYCCLVFVYDTIEYKVGKATKISAVVKKYGSVVEFKESSRNDLFNWIDRHFAACGREIGYNEKEYLVFLCGSLMTGLIGEIEKIASYARERRITVEDIDAAAVPVLEASIFKMTDAISLKEYDNAAGILGNLLQHKEEPIKLLAIIGSQIRRIYFAKTAVNEGKNTAFIQEIYDMKSDYPAKMLIQSARRFSLHWCRRAVKLCADYDFQMKSSGTDNEALVKQLLVELALC